MFSFSAQKRKPLRQKPIPEIKIIMLKPFYLKKEEIPAGLVDAYLEKNGRWELDELADDVPIVQTKKSLEATQITLKEDLRKAIEAKTRAEVNQLPAGKIAVEPEIETLGTAAKAAGLAATEIPSLKTKADELQGKLEAVEYETTLSTVAKDHNLNGKFVALAKDKKLKFESKKEKDGEEEKTVWDVLTEKDGKTEKQKLDDFLKNDSFFKEFADTFAVEENDEGEGEGGENQGKKWVKQESGKGKKGKTEFDEIREEIKNNQKSKPTDNASVLAALNGQPPQPPATN